MKKTITVLPQKLSGKLVVPPSKSAAHRALICATLAQGNSTVLNIAQSNDILATINAAKTLGATVDFDGTTVSVAGGTSATPLQGEDFFCNESGSTLRFFIPILLARGGSFTLSGRGRLMKRPLDDYFRIFDEKGISYKIDGDKLHLNGKLKSGTYQLAGNVSSQYITGLLFALPLLNSDSVIEITTPTESVGYIDMTIEMMKRFGVEVEKDEVYQRFKIRGNQTYQPQIVTVEGDYSQAAFFLVANALGSNVDVLGLSETSSQGDKEIIEIIKQLQKKEAVHTVDVSQVPDLVPILSVLAAKSSGKTHFVNGLRLRMKESDRLHAVCEELAKLGVEVKEEQESFWVSGESDFRSATVDSHNDHRMAMSLAIAATVAEGSVTITDADSVQKSYGDFWEKFKSLKGEIRPCLQSTENYLK